MNIFLKKLKAKKDSHFQYEEGFESCLNPCDHDNSHESFSNLHPELSKISGRKQDTLAQIYAIFCYILKRQHMVEGIREF